MVRKISSALLAFGLLFTFGLGCHFGGRLNYDADDIKSAQRLADQYFLDLRDKKYAAVIEKVAPDLRGILKEAVMASDMDGRFSGEPIQSWSVKESSIVPAPDRRVRMLYSVHSASVTRDFELIAALATGPEHWQLVGIDLPNDAAANAHAEDAKIKAYQFLDGLRQHKYAEGRELFSELAKKRNPPKDMPVHGREFEDLVGEIKRSEMVGNYDTTGTLAGDRRNYTVIVYQVEGTKSTAVLFFIMYKSDDEWQIEAIQPNAPMTSPPPEQAPPIHSRERN
jgi:hypothetical protein